MSTPILSQIETKIETLLEGILSTNGYFFSWGLANEDDRALEDSTKDAFVSIMFNGEDGLLDKFDVSGGKFRNRVDYTLNCRVPLTAEYGNPKFASGDRARKALADIKKLFADNEHLGITGVEKVMIMSATKDESKHQYGDRFTCEYINIEVSVWYSQDKLNPFIFAS